MTSTQKTTVDNGRFVPPHHVHVHFDLGDWTITCNTCGFTADHPDAAAEHLWDTAACPSIYNGEHCQLARPHVRHANPDGTWDDCEADNTVDIDAVRAVNNDPNAVIAGRGPNAPETVGEVEERLRRFLREAAHIAHEFPPSGYSSGVVAGLTRALAVVYDVPMAAVVDHPAVPLSPEAVRRTRQGLAEHLEATLRAIGACGSHEEKVDTMRRLSGEARRREIIHSVPPCAS